MQKTGADGTVSFLYDEAGHLIGEYDGSNAVIEETVYLGDTPIAILTGSSTIQYIHADHLDTPRAITSSSGQVLWRWDSDPFGNGLPNEDVDGNGQLVTYNLRFPGQYYDKTAGTHYNYHRDYEPMTGRYIQSDPIGIDGGLNTYAYALNSPMRWTDSLGLDVFLCHRPADLPFPLNQFDHYWIRTDTREAGMGGMRGGVPAQGGNSDWPYDPTQTVNHEGQSKTSNASCEKQENVDEQCVNESIQPGQPTGRWHPYNQCQSFAYGTISKCRTGPQMPPQP